MIDLLKPTKEKLKITAILVLIIFTYIFIDSSTNYFLTNHSAKEFEKLINIEEMNKEAKPLLEKIVNRTYEGSRFSSIYFRQVITGAVLTIIYVILLSYLGACILNHRFHKKVKS